MEAVISRMKTMEKEMNKTRAATPQQAHFNCQYYIRYIALSATIPNVQDICDWLGRTESVPAEKFIFGDEYRPVTLEKHVLGFPCRERNDFTFDQVSMLRIYCLLQVADF